MSHCELVYFQFSVKLSRTYPTVPAKHKWKHVVIVRYDVLKITLLKCPNCGGNHRVRKCIPGLQATAGWGKKWKEGEQCFPSFKLRCLPCSLSLHAGKKQILMDPHDRNASLLKAHFSHFYFVLFVFKLQPRQDSTPLSFPK